LETVGHRCHIRMTGHDGCRLDLFDSNRRLIRHPNIGSELRQGNTAGDVRVHLLVGYRAKLALICSILQIGPPWYNCPSSRMKAGGFPAIIQM